MKRTKKALAVLLATLLTLALVPMSVHAQITSPLDFRAMASGTGEGWAWDQSTLTLTLEDFDFYIDDLYYDFGAFYAIELPGGSTVVLEGVDNTISVGDAYACIRAYGDLAFTGEGSLRLSTCGNGEIGGYGIIANYECSGDITISECALAVEADSGITADNITVNSGALVSGWAGGGMLCAANDVTFTGAAAHLGGRNDAIKATGGSVAFTDSMVVIDGEGDWSGGIRAGGDITLDGSYAGITVGDRACGMSAGNDITITACMVAIDATEEYGRGICANNDLKIFGGTVKIDAYNDGLCAYNEFLVSDASIAISSIDGAGICGASVSLIGVSGTVKSTADPDEYTNEDDDYFYSWAIVSGEEINVDTATAVMGWDGSDYTVAAAQDSVTYTEEWEPEDEEDDGFASYTYYFFVDANDPGTPLMDVQFGPAPEITWPPLDFINNITVDYSGEGWDWVRSTKTLTLDGLDLSYDAEPEGFGIRLPGGATIVLAQDSENFVTTNDQSYGIMCMGALAIRGEGALTIDAAAGLAGLGGFTLEGGTVTINADFTGMNVYGGSEISGGTLVVNGEQSDGIILQAGDFTLSGGTLEINAAGFGLFTAAGNVTIGTDLTIHAGYAGIYAYGGGVTIESGMVNVTADDCWGIHAGGGDLAINGGTLAVSAGADGLLATDGDIAINGGSGTVMTLDDDGEAVYSYGTLTVADGVPVKGWDGSGYTIDAVNDGKTFTDADSIWLKRIQFGDVVPPPHTHNYGTAWVYDVDNHWHECGCGDKSEVEAHTSGEWMIVLEATATTDGSRQKKCTFCQAVTDTEVIPATGGGEAVKYVRFFKWNTKYPSNFWNWFMFVVLFGFIWMWFI